MFEGNQPPIKPSYALYPYQRQVLADIIRALALSERRAVAHLPTGAGKTRIATHAACHLLNQKEGSRALVVWLAATEELCEQATDQLVTGWTFLGRRDAYVHRYWGDRELDLGRLQSGFLITGLAKLRAAASYDPTLLAHLANQVCAVIFDEAHQAVAETYSFVTEQLCSYRPPLLGLTATPGRTASLTDTDYQLATMFRHTKVSIDPRGHDSPVTYLIQNKYLADPEFVPVEFDSRIPVDSPVTGTDYDTRDLDRLGRDMERTCLIAELAERAVARHPRTIVFCPSVESARECNQRLQSKGIATSVITADSTSQYRQGAIESFKSDKSEHMVMFNFGVLTAGFDAPRTRCVIIARPTTSLVLYSQMVGRALRGPRSGGNLRAEIFTVADTNLPGFGSVTEAFENWEELWSNI